MKIERVEAIWLHVDLDKSGHHVSSFGNSRAFDTTLVRVHTACGLVGHGEARASVNSFGSNAGLWRVIEDDLAPQILGEDPRDIRRIWDILYNGPRHDLALERGQVVPILPRRGLTICALSGIDIALWDILGQSLNVPVWQLLGGRRNGEAMPAYASGGWGSADAIGDELLGYLEKAPFSAVKMRVSPRDGGLRESALRVQRAREAIGPDVGLMIDAHGSFSVSEAKRLCRLVEDFDLLWFEEPVTGDNKSGLGEVRASTAIPIAAGEAEFTRFAFRDLIEANAVDVVQPDLAIVGGITEALRIEALASAYHKKFAAHIWTGAPAFSAGIQVSAVASTAFILEFALGANPMLNELSDNPPEIVDGCVKIPDEPGLGIRINEDFVRKFRVNPEGNGAWRKLA